MITSLRTGGAEKLMVDLLPRLRSRGHDVELLVFDGTDTPFRRELEAAGIRIHDLGKGGSVYSPLRLLRLIPFLRRYDVVHTHNTAPQLFAAIGNLVHGTCRLCTTEHNTSNRRRKWKWFAAIDRLMYSRYRSVVCISAKAEENLRAFIGGSSAEICTIDNGVDITRYASAEASGELERRAPGSRKIVMVAGFREQKDQDTLIRAMKHLPDSFHLFLVGDGERRGVLEALAGAEGLTGRVHFLGVRTDVAELLNAADYVVMSSHYEGLSLSSVEGMSVGKPFLASDVDGLREVVKGAGVLFPHGDAEALAGEIMKLDADGELYRCVASDCRARAARYDISRMVEGYLKVYKSLEK